VKAAARPVLACSFCSHFSWRGTCRCCGCNRREHRWRNIETKVVTKSIYRPDQKVIDEIVDSSAALKVINDGITQIEDRVDKCENEKQQMLEICAKLNAFAHKNALVETSKEEDELLRCLENERQTYAMLTNTSSQVDDLATIKSQYEQHLSKAMGYSHRVHVEDVPKLIEQLYRLPIKGNAIRRVMDEEENARRKVIEECQKSKMIYKVKQLSSLFYNFSDLTSKVTELVKKM